MDIRPLMYRVRSSDLLRKIAETFATRIYLIAIGVVTNVIVARILGPEGRGVYAVAVAVGAIGVQVLNLGLHSSNMYYVAKDRKLLAVLVSNSLAVSLLGGTLAGLATYAVFLLFPSAAPLAGLTLVLALVWIPFGLGYLLLQNLLMGIQDVRAYNQLEAVTRTSIVVLVGALILFHQVTTDTVFAAGLAAMVAGMAWAWMLLRVRGDGWRRPSVRVFSGTLRYGFKAYVASVAAFVTLRIGLLTVKYDLGAEQAGYYSVATNLADLVYLLPVVVGTVVFPRLTAMTDRAAQWKLTKQLLKGVGLVMLVFITIAFFCADLGIRLLYGKAFLPAVAAFQWLMPGTWFWGCTTIPLQFLAAIGFPVEVDYLWLAVVVLNVILNLLIIPVAGIVGAAWVATATYSFSFLIFTIYASRMAHRPPVEASGPKPA